ncbi:MAG: glycosyltransferase family 2 protein [Gemmatimonadales bacterium]
MPRPPFISAFTVIRNARILGYPIAESIRSILPIVDEFVIGVGESEDDTLELLASIDDPRIRIFESGWDMSRPKGGRLLADKTNEALDRCSGKWCFYLQADEVVHERDLPAIRAACEAHSDDERVEGLLFDYVHLYGSYSIVATMRAAYRREVRIVRRSSGARSVGDAQSFLIGGKRKPRVRLANATIYHYGWVHSPERLRRKRANRAVLYERPELLDGIEQMPIRQVYGLRRFRGSHPAVMADIVAQQNWQFEPRLDLRQWNRRDYKNLASDMLELVIRRRLGERKFYTLLDGA